MSEAEVLFKQTSSNQQTKFLFQELAVPSPRREKFAEVYDVLQAAAVNGKVVGGDVLRLALSLDPSPSDEK